MLVLSVMAVSLLLGPQAPQPLTPGEPLFLPSLQLPGPAQERPDSATPAGQDTTLITVVGKVLDRYTTRPLANVIIRIPALQILLLSDSAGAFRLEDIRPGVYRMVLSRMGYREEDGDFTVRKPGSFSVTLSPVLVAEGAGPGRVVGRVVAPESGEPLMDAVVSIAGTDLRRTTNRQGWFELLEVPAGYQMLRVEFLGREAREDTLFVGEDQVVELTVPLGVEPIALEGFTVTAHPRWLVASGFFRRRGRSYEGKQWTREELEELDPVFLQDILTTVPGIRSMGTSGGLYGRRKCKLALFVDDFRVEDWYLDMIEPRNVEALEIYHGTQKPGEFFWYCGIVLVWLRH